jgi:phosphatidate cytidylyltransferase
MFPFLSMGSQIGVAMTALYGLLGLTSLSVRLAGGAAPRGSLSAQVNAWWRIFPFITLALLIYPLGPALLVCLIWLLAVVELAPYHGASRRRFWAGALALSAFALLVQWLMPQLISALFSAMIFLQYWRFSNRPDHDKLVSLLLLVTVGALSVLPLYAQLPFTATTNLAWLFYLFVLTALNDIGQFVSGKLFGRQKIAPQISPNKTWQGLMGGMLVSQLVTLVLGQYFDLGEPGRLACYALLLSPGGFVGDLMFSAAKRYLGIKDFSQLIPGHGGILDRVDSLVITAPLLYWLIRTFE